MDSEIQEVDQGNSDNLWKEMKNSQIVILVIGALLAILQALILFILKDLKATMKEFVRKDLCKERHINVDRRIGVVEKSVETSGVHTIPPVQRD